MGKTSEQILLYRSDKKINLYYFVFSQIQTCNSFILEDYIILNIPWSRKNLISEEN